MVFIGLVTLLFIGGYLIFIVNEKSNLEQLNVNLNNGLSYDNIAVTIDEQDIDNLSIIDLPAHFSRMHFGVLFHPKYWHDPIKTGTDTRLLTEITEGFDLASSLDNLALVVPKGTATRILIPMLNIDSPVDELGIIDLGDSQEYETPDNTVGHIPETADPGEVGNGWFFGHLESPFSGEGNVFHRLPEIPELLREINEIGEGGINIIIHSSTGEYLYQVTSSEVLHADELKIYGSDNSRISLVTCVPRLEYSHRLVIKAILVGVKAH
ncbi:MAG: Sortase (surface protein transpeptidase) [Chloroflexi bacterium]|jgi:sortase (surface protein transpeptidase)|nr:MAG: Sortase (surface protein transpeptidase) [Chloroflexota bacterium]